MPRSRVRRDAFVGLLRTDVLPFMHQHRITFTVELLGQESQALLTLSSTVIDSITDEAFQYLVHRCVSGDVAEVRNLGQKLFINGFVKSDGEFESCPYGGHIRLATAHGYHDDDSAKQAGWIKVSLGSLSRVVRPTTAQVAWVQGPYTDSGHSVPDWVAEYQSVPDDTQYVQRLRECLRQT